MNAEVPAVNQAHRCFTDVHQATKRKWKKGFVFWIIGSLKHKNISFWAAHSGNLEGNKANERSWARILMFTVLWLQELQHAEQQKSPNGRQSQVTSIHLTSELNPPALFPRAQLNHVDVSELRDNSLFLYSRLTAPVDFNWTLHQSWRPDLERLSAASGETIEWLRRLTRGISERVHVVFCLISGWMQVQILINLWTLSFLFKVMC